MIIIDDNYSNIMLDLESLSTKPNAVITAIGAVLFTKTELLTEFEIIVNIDSSLRRGFICDGDTIAWWMSQSDEARAIYRNQKRQPSISKALIDFQTFCNKIDKAYGKPITLWGNAASFDCSILSNAYARLCFTQPWDYRNEKCYRTFNKSRPDLEYAKPIIPHNALEDAKAQAVHLMKINSTQQKRG